MPKHPTQLYEAFSYLILGIIMVLIYRYKADRVYRGFFFGFFLLGCFGMRFLIEFIKEPQVGFEESMVLDMGQLLSIPFIVAGVVMLVMSYVRKSPDLLVKPDNAVRKPSKKDDAPVAHSKF